MQARPISRATAVVGAGLALLLGSGCALTEGNARSTLPPLPPPGVALAPAAAPAPQTPTPSTLAPGETLPSDDANPASVAGRFLAAAASGDADTGAALAIADRDPAVFDWALQNYESTVAVAGDTAWGSPSCGEPAGATVGCTWLLNDQTTSLVLTQSNGTWRVSHPLTTPTGDPAALGERCIIGDVPINMRGGPAKLWPKFASLSPDRCDIATFDATATDSEGVWRLVEADGQRGWIVDRVLQSP